MAVDSELQDYVSTIITRIYNATDKKQGLILEHHEVEALKYYLKCVDVLIEGIIEEKINPALLPNKNQTLM